MTPRLANTFVIIAAFATGIYCAVVVVILGGYALGQLLDNNLIPLSTVQFVASWWAYVFAADAMVQALPMFAVAQIETREFKLDKYTSWAPLIVAVLMTLVFLVWVKAMPGVWTIISLTYISWVIGMMYVGIMATLRREWREANPPQP